ncbi:MAG: cell wall-binding repeat-containing protein [Firmicutes bacterium]|nr:cell wall-binding repeat-containing protein [Bacillota bacterium]
MHRWKQGLRVRRVASLAGISILGVGLVAGMNGGGRTADAAGDFAPQTPIKHLVVIFQENVSFDHYFGTYPNATNPAGEPSFQAAPNTPSVNGLNDALLNHNPNSANPQRLDRSQAMTADMDHGYAAEQKAANGGMMNRFVEETGRSDNPSIVMDYYDGNTVTALWNYAQHFAMSDNSYNTTFGPSTPGALNLVSGQTHGATATAPDGTNSTDVKNEVANGAVIGDPDPTLDDCSSTKYPTVSMSGKNVGDLLNAKGITWGWFEGGFRPTSTQDGKAVCGESHTNVGGASVTDYIPHHEPFQYYPSTANPHHLPPSSVDKIGYTDQANHQYDLSDFWAAAENGNLPAVSFLKAAAYQDGHAGYSDPLDEQTFLVDTLNRLQALPTWKDTAVIISYDDSDGWYDHVMSPIVNPSNDPNYDAFLGTPKLGNYQDRAGYGPRLPLLVISPYAKQNFVDHSITDQSSILRFIEDNWGLGRIGDASYDAIAGPLDNLFDFHSGQLAPKLLLDSSTGEPVKAASHAIGGKDRYETAINVLGDATVGWKGSSDKVILVNGARGHAVDALAANSLAGALHAPVMVVDGNASVLKDAQKQFVSKLGAKQALVVGMPLQASLNQQLVQMGLQVDNKDFHGSNRYTTALAVADYITNHTDATPKQIFLATGTALPDALSAGPLAAGEADIVLLVNPKGNNSAVVTKANALKQSYGAPVYALGDPAAVPDNVVKATDATRISGNDRYQTNLTFLKTFVTKLDSGTLYITNGAPGHEVDALSVGSVAGQAKHPLLLTDGEQLSPEQQAWLTSYKGAIQQVVFVGGMISDGLKAAVQDALK